jgi:WhiB family redox-sensing transcriptional regulator
VTTTNAPADAKYWRDIAACRDHDPETWFPHSDAEPNTLQIGDAETICRTQCPVREHCLRWALEHPGLASHGIWGGHSETELRAMRLSARQRRHYDGTIRLTDRQQQLLNHLANNTPPTQLAELLGITPKTVESYLYDIRKALQIRNTHQIVEAAREAGLLCGGFAGQREPAPPTPPRRNEYALAQCGSPAAYRRHQRRGEPIDAACREANRQEWHQRKPVTAA